MATTARSTFHSYPHATDQAFFTKMALCLTFFILFGFAQFSLRGFAHPLEMPAFVHVHAIAMTAWLGLFVVQNALAGRGDMALHRTLGWASVGLVGFIVFMAMYTGRAALMLGMVPPFFTAPFFLALTHVEPVAFAALFTVAVALRRQTQWHRRLMLAATVVLMEPALGRLIPVPLTGVPVATVLQILAQLGVLALVARHDRAMTGKVHPATLTAMAAILLVHGTVGALAEFPPFVALAQGMAGAQGIAGA